MYELCLYSEFGCGRECESDCTYSYSYRYWITYRPRSASRGYKLLNTVKYETKIDIATKNVEKRVRSDVCVNIGTAVNTGMTAGVGVSADFDAGLGATAHLSMQTVWVRVQIANEDIVETYTVIASISVSTSLGAGVSIGI